MSGGAIAIIIVLLIFVILPLLFTSVVSILALHTARSLGGTLEVSGVNADGVVIEDAGDKIGGRALFGSYVLLFATLGFTYFTFAVLPGWIDGPSEVEKIIGF